MKWGVGREEGVSAPPLTPKLIIGHIGEKQQKPFLGLQLDSTLASLLSAPVVPG